MMKVCRVRCTQYEQYRTTLVLEFKRSFYFPINANNLTRETIIKSRNNDDHGMCQISCCMARIACSIGWYQDSSYLRVVCVGACDLLENDLTYGCRFEAVCLYIYVITSQFDYTSVHKRYHIIVHLSASRFHRSPSPQSQSALLVRLFR
jgi:hypothetical protein